MPGSPIYHSVTDWCDGCEIPVQKRVDLSEGWVAGYPLPEGLTVHYTAREGRRFAFRGDPYKQDRVYLDSPHQE